jgi:hypothetical protein
LSFFTIESIIEGLEMTDKVFLSTMVKFGVESINPEGEPFNPELHEAITMLPIALAICLWHKEFHKKKILFLVDNMAVVSIRTASSGTVSK